MPRRLLSRPLAASVAGILACALAAAFVLASGAGATTPGKNGLIAFTRYRLQDKPLWSEIWVANPDGTGLLKVSHSPVAVEEDQPHFSPDGTWIVFTRCPVGACSLWLVHPDGTEQRRLSPPCSPKAIPPVCVDESNASFMPDGKHIVFQYEHGRIRHDAIEHSDLAEFDLAGKHLTILFRSPAFHGDVHAPRASPDGKRLAFERVDSLRGKPQAIFVANIGGGALRRLTSWSMGATSPDWSPDGQLILFRNSKDDSELNPGTNLFTVRPDGTGLHQLTHLSPYHYALAGSWSPDGTSIVFATDRGATPNPRGGTFADIFTMRLGDSTTTQVTHAANLDGWPTWGPAG